MEVALKKRLILIGFLALFLGVGGLVYRGQRIPSLTDLYYSATIYILCRIISPSAGSGQVAGYDILTASESIRRPWPIVAQTQDRFGC